MLASISPGSRYTRSPSVQPYRSHRSASASLAVQKRRMLRCGSRYMDIRCSFRATMRIWSVSRQESCTRGLLRWGALRRTLFLSCGECCERKFDGSPRYLPHGPVGRGLCWNAATKALTMHVRLARLCKSRWRVDGRAVVLGPGLSHCCGVL